MPDTDGWSDVNDMEYVPADFFRSERENYRISLQPSVSSGPLNSPQTASSIYSRSAQNHTDGAGIAGIADDKDTERLDGLIHPAMRHSIQSVASFTSLGEILRRMPSVSGSLNDDDADADHAHAHRSRDHYPETPSPHRPSVGGSSGEVRLRPSPNNEEEAEQQGTGASSATQSVRKRRLCTVSRVAFAVLSLVTVAILILCICTATGVLGSNTSAPSVPGEAATTSSEPPSTEAGVATRDLKSSISDGDDISATSLSSSPSSLESTRVVTKTSESPKGWTTTVQSLTNQWSAEPDQGAGPTARNAAGDINLGVPATAPNPVPPIHPPSEETQTVMNESGESSAEGDDSS